MRSFSMFRLFFSDRFWLGNPFSKPLICSALSKRSIALKSSANVDKVKLPELLSKMPELLADIGSAIRTPSLDSTKAAVALKWTLASKSPPFSRWLTRPSTPCSLMRVFNWLSISIKSLPIIWSMNSCAETFSNAPVSKSPRRTVTTSLEESKFAVSSAAEVSKAEKFANMALLCPFAEPFKLNWESGSPDVTILLDVILI